jgi:phage terminase Nu1 subunit (DNA packaging protein)
MTAAWPTRPQRDADEEPGALRPKRAARFLDVSERTLWTWTKAGLVPHIKRGKVTLYPRELLVEWLRSQATKPEGGAT